MATPVPVAAAGEPWPASLAETDLARLRQAVGRLPQPAFAVLDGAQWNDIATELAGLGVRGRSLFLGAGETVEAAGPWLVALGQSPEAADAVLGWVADKPAAVFWGCAAGEAALWRHMRTLAQVRMAGVPEGSEVVSFRYWDPRAVSCIVPLLDPEQYARVLGPADEVLFHDPRAMGGVGVRRAQRTPDLPVPPRGMLALTGPQVEALDADMQERSRRRIAVYLQRTSPEEAQHLTGPELERFVRDVEAEGKLAGLDSERAHGQWAYLSLTTGGALGRDGRVLGYVKHGPGVPDTNLDRLFEQMTRLAQADARAEGGR